MYEDEIETISELVHEVSQQRTGGYDVDFDILPNQARARHGNGFFLIVQVKSSNPNLDEPSIGGEWWFEPDGRVMQVL